MLENILNIISFVDAYLIKMWIEEEFFFKFYITYKNNLIRHYFYFVVHLSNLMNSDQNILIIYSYLFIERKIAFDYLNTTKYYLFF